VLGFIRSISYNFDVLSIVSGQRCRFMRSFFEFNIADCTSAEAARCKFFLSMEILLSTALSHAVSTAKRRAISAFYRASACRTISVCLSVRPPIRSVLVFFSGR